MNAENGETGIRRYIPILAWLPQYQRKWLRPDFIAGLTIMALLVPEGMAYAQLAGMPPQAALLRRADWSHPVTRSLGLPASSL